MSSSITYAGYNGTTYQYAPQEQSGAILKLTSSSSSELDIPDGSKQIFGTANAASPRKVFLTQTVDPQGNILTYSYDSDYRIVAVAGPTAGLHAARPTNSVRRILDGATTTRASSPSKSIARLPARRNSASSTAI